MPQPAKRERSDSRPLILGTEVEGEAKDVAGFFAAIAREIGSTGNPVSPPACVLAAGETTVTVRGKVSAEGIRKWRWPGLFRWHQGRLAMPCCFASVATDGSDGPTDAAGGMVDPLTSERAVALGLVAISVTLRTTTR